MATFDLGRVTPLYKGDYSASASYELNDVVLYNGNLYWHVQATATVGILPTDTTVWKLAFADEGIREEIRGYADNAQASADSALASKSAAATSASNASASASQAALSAQSASTKASEASTSAQTASTKASEASASAQSAASSAQTATDKATLASQKAAAASESASLATAKASAAATSETNAAASAQTASAKASEAAASATSAQEYDESAQQSAVNAQTAQGLAETARTGAETAQGLAEDARDLAQQYAESIDPEHIYSAYPTDTASGAVASFPDGADDIPLKSLVVNIDPVQSGSGDPSPDNVRPISGWTGAKVARTGKNLFGGEAFRDAVLAQIPNAEVGEDENGRYIRLTASSAILDKVLIDNCFKSNTQYTFFFKYEKSNTNGASNLGIFYADGYIRYPQFSGTVEANTIYSGREVTMANKTIEVLKTVWASGTATIYYDEFGIFEGDVPISDFEPYNGTTIPINWQTEAGTVYGGSLDVLSGVLTVYPYYASYNGETLTGRWISDRDVYAVGTTPTIGAQVVNIGAEGTEIRLSPHEVKSLLGQNNIFADTGDSSVEYRADTKLYIERLTEPDADMIADANITSGSYFMVGNSLYLATSNIASGGQVIVGTNCTHKSLSEALNEINS